MLVGSFHVPSPAAGISLFYHGNRCDTAQATKGKGSSYRRTWSMGWVCLDAQSMSHSEDGVSQVPPCGQDCWIISVARVLAEGDA